MKNGKHIQAVQIRYIVDSDPDTSYLDQPEFTRARKQYQEGQFTFIGIQAKAEIAIPTGKYISDRHNAKDSQIYTTEQIRSGGLWGIESDSNREYLEEIETEQLTELKTELTALGFSKRAISKAFQNIERKDS